MQSHICMNEKWISFADGKAIFAVALFGSKRPKVFVENSVHFYDVTFSLQCQYCNQY